jgi:hypothetical protein
MAKGVRFTDIDRGAKSLLALVGGLAKTSPAIAVGILAASGGTAHGAGLTVLDVGTFNEFGTVGPDGRPRVPARSFIRGWYDEHRVEGGKRLAGLMRQVVARKLTQEQALEQFGLWAQGSMQARMAQGIPPPNAEATVERKGSSTPLIDTGQLRSSVSFEVRKR